MSPTRNTVQPYPSGTRWLITSRYGHTETKALALYAEPNGSSITDDFLPEEMSAAQLWRM